MSEPLNRDLYAKIYGDDYVDRLDAEHRQQNEPPRPPRQPYNQLPPNPGYAQRMNPYGQQQVGPYGTPLQPQPYQQPGAYAQTPYGYPAYPPRKEHSIGIHILLFLLTGGLGNVVYFICVNSENRRLGYY